MIGYTQVYIGTLERSLIAYRANDARMLDVMEEYRSKAEELFDGSRLARRRLFYAKWFGWLGFSVPTRREKLRSFDGYYSKGFASVFSSEFPIIHRLVADEGVVDPNEFCDWYYSSEVKPYKDLLLLFQNTQGDSLMLSPEGCKFINKWGPRYEGY